MALDTDIVWMRRALKLARRGQGLVEPNPMVGAILVRDGTAVGRGWHRRFGGPHAEVEALTAAGDRARGATLYVTLEPCCHHGKTPPCTDAVIRAGIRRVVAAMPDPFPAVAGQGLAALRAAGIEVRVGACERDAADLNRPFLTLVRLGRPYVHAKWAMTLDGRIAARTGHSKWISGERARRIVHGLRGRVDAIIVGANTVRHDDPLLTARPPGPRVASRVVLSSAGSLPAGCQLLATRASAPVLVATLNGQGTDLRDQGIEVVELPALDGRPSVANLMQELGRRRMSSVLVEGGSTLLGSIHDAGLIDEAHVFVAPKFVGGATALGPIGGLGVEAVDRPIRPVTRCHLAQAGPDWYFNVRFGPAAGSP